MAEHSQTPQQRIAAAARPTRLDTLIGRVAPGIASNRIKSRVDHELRMMLMDRTAAKLSAYEAADHDRLRGEKWLPSRLSSNDAIGHELETLIERAQDLYRNDCYAASAINGRVDNVIGGGIRPQSRVVAKRGVITPAQAEEFNQQAERVFAKWARLERWEDKQRQLERCNGIYGESWLHMADSDDPQKPVTLSVQVIHPQRIPLHSIDPRNGLQRRRLGMRLNSAGEPIAAFVTRTLPNDSHAYDLSETEVNLDDLLHCYEETTPGQLRGVPWLTPAMGKLKDLKDFVHANLIAEQVAACYGAFVSGVTDPMVLAGQARVRSNLEDMAPGAIQYLGDGETVTFSDPARPGTTLAPYVEWALHGVAASLRYPYELLAKQFTNNFSGGRLALIDGRITFKIWQSCLIERVFRRVWARFIDQCVFQGALQVDLLKYEQNRDHFLQHQWIPPGWPWVDPEKEVRADVQAIEAGLQTQTESLAARGRDFDETLNQIEREQRQKADMEARMMEYRKTLGLGGEAGGDAGAGSHSAKDRLDAYGVGVRAGAITSQMTDEAVFRSEMGLPEMSAEARKAWQSTGNVRAPITLVKPGESTTDAEPQDSQPAEDTPSDQQSDDDMPEELHCIEAELSQLSMQDNPQNGDTATLAVAQKYTGINFKPPAGVRAEATQGLMWRREHGRGGTEVGIARARDLSNGKAMSPETINRMVSFFARHEVDKQGKGFSPGEPGFPSNGRIAWALWGGDPGKAWSNKVKRQMEARDKAE